MATLAAEKPAVINPTWKSVPPMGAPDDEVKAYLKRHFNDGSRYRRWQMQRMAMNTWMYLGRQWIREAKQLRSDGSGAYRFVEIKRKSAAAFPRPVDNMIADGVDNIVSRLGRKEFEPSTRPSKNDPKIEAAARLAKDILLFDMEEMVWADKREEIHFNLVVMGTAIARSLWDETATDISVLASPDAVSCPACGNLYASAKVPRVFAELGQVGTGQQEPTPFRHRETLTDVPRQQGKPQEVQMNVCPTCPEPVPLVQHSVSVEEAQNQTDPFGRPMGVEVPKGEGLIEIVSPADLYPQNGGVGIEPNNCRVWGQKTIRDMEWVATHFPDYVDRVEPQDPRELLRCDPILGDDAFSGTGSTGVGEPDIYFNHAAVMELTVDPIPLRGLEKGRRFAMIGDHVCRNDELTTAVDVPDGSPRKVARTKYAAARYKRIPRQFWGRTPVDDAVPLNKRLNEIDAMMGDIREKGAPRVFVPPGTEIYQHEDTEGSLDFIEVDSIGGNWSPKDGLFAGIPLTGNAYMEERASISRSLDRVLGYPAVQRGVNDTGVKTAQQLQILSEEAAQKQNPLERSLVQMEETLFTHHLEVTWAFRREDTEYEIQREAGDFERDSYVGTDILAQTKVKVETRGTFDKTLYQQQAVQNGITAGVYAPQMQTETGLDEIRDLLGLPKVETEKSVQIERAEQAWREWIDHGTIPVIDPTIDDAAARYQVLAKRWLSDEGVAKRRDAGFDAILPKLAGWDRKLAIASAQNDQQLAAYEGHDPQTWQTMFQQASQLAQAAGQPAPFPPPPQNGQFLPEGMYERVMVTFQGVLGEAFPAMDPNLQAVPQEALMPDAKASMALLPVLEMYAVIQAYRLMVKTAVAPAGAPPMPGADAGGAPPAPSPQPMAASSSPTAGGQ